MLQVRIFNRFKKAHEDRLIYTAEEAEAAGIKYKPWIECREAGDWGLSDDGYVTELIACRLYGDSGNYGYWSFTGGLVKRYKNDFGKNKCFETLTVGPLITGERRQKKITEALKTDKAKKILRAYILHDKKIDIAVQAVLPAAPMVEINKWRTVAKSEEFKKMVKQEILDILTTLGFDRKRAILLLDEAIQMAREKKDVTNMMRATETLFDILGFNDKDVKKESIGYEQKTIERLADRINEQHNKLSASREVPLLEE